MASPVFVGVEERLNPRDRVQRYAVLDAMRFELALWVTIGHYEMFPLFAGVNATTRFGWLLTHGWQTVVLERRR